MSEVFRPGVLHGGYPERVAPRPPRIERMLERFRGRARGERPTVAKLRAQAADVIARSDALADASAGELDRRLAELRPALRRKLTGEPLLAALALVREHARREIGMAHFDIQLMAGAAMLYGMLVELDTGEGKTL